MKNLVLAAVLAALSGLASAQGVGTSTFYSCSDASGNSYTVNRLGNTTMMSGSNAATGSTWNQQSTRMGNTTIINGDTNGRSWNSTIQSTGSATYQYGTDSRGKPFSKTCTAYGCF